MAYTKQNFKNGDVLTAEQLNAVDDEVEKLGKAGYITGEDLYERIRTTRGIYISSEYVDMESTKKGIEIGMDAETVELLDTAIREIYEYTIQVGSLQTGIVGAFTAISCYNLELHSSLGFDILIEAFGSGWFNSVPYHDAGWVIPTIPAFMIDTESGVQYIDNEGRLTDANECEIIGKRIIKY